MVKGASLSVMFSQSVCFLKKKKGGGAGTRKRDLSRGGREAYIGGSLLNLYAVNFVSRVRCCG